MPRARDSIEVDQGEPVLADDLEVVAGDRRAPPRFLDAPAVADLDRLPLAVPAEGDEAAGRVQLGVDERVLAQEGSS